MLKKNKRIDIDKRKKGEKLTKDLLLKNLFHYATQWHNLTYK